MSDLILGWPDFVLDLADAVVEMPESAYLVGGAVRDAILRRSSHDLDMVTTDSGIKLGRRIANRFNGDFYVLDDARDVGRVLIETDEGRWTIDVSGLRANDLAGDLAERDFTINAFAVDLKADLNQVIDPLGGAGDLLAKRLRACGPQSIAADPIRILRAIRQSVQFGLRITPDTLQQMRAQMARLDEPSPERVRDELIKLLALPKGTTALRVADALGVMAILVPELTAQHGLAQSPPHIYDAWNHTLAVIEALSEIVSTIRPNRTDNTAAQFNLGTIVVSLDRFRARLQDHLAKTWAEERPHSALLALAALLHDIGKPIVKPIRDERGRMGYPGHESIGAEIAVDRLAELRLSNAERKFVTTLIAQHMDRAMWTETLTPIDIYRFWKRMGEDGIDLILLTFADYLGAVGHAYDQVIWLHLVGNAQILLDAYYERREALIDPPMLVNGDSLMSALNIQAGPTIGDLLEHIREGQVLGDILTRDDALGAARRFLDQRSEG